VRLHVPRPFTKRYLRNSTGITASTPLVALQLDQSLQLLIAPQIRCKTKLNDIERLTECVFFCCIRLPLDCKAIKAAVIIHLSLKLRHLALNAPKQNHGHELNNSGLHAVGLGNPRVYGMRAYYSGLSSE
jgi:hypothetical protein